MARGSGDHSSWLARAMYELVSEALPSLHPYEVLMSDRLQFLYAYGDLEQGILSIDRSLDRKRYDGYKMRPIAFRCALLDKRVVGYAACLIGRKSVRVLRFYIDPTVRRKGYGRQLLADLLDGTDKEKKPLYFKIDSRDSRAVSFLRACGVPCVGLDDRGMYRFKRNRVEVSRGR